MAKKANSAEDVFKVIEKNPMKLKDVKGITKKTIEKIVKSYMKDITFVEF